MKKVKTTITSENIERHNEWLKTQSVVNIPVDSIFLKEKIHKTAKVNFTWLINRMRSKDITILNSPIVVRLEENNKYSLISGYKGFILAKELNHKEIPAIIINNDRKEFIKENGFKNSYCWMPIEKVIVPKEFLERKVTRVKVQKCIDYYKSHGEMDKPVSIKGKKLCVDGYSRLVAAKILGLEKVFCEFV